MRILVTGGAGFIGSHVVDSYVTAGHRVTVVDNLVSGNVKNLNRRARFVKVDVRGKTDGTDFQIRPVRCGQPFGGANRCSAQCGRPCFRCGCEHPGFAQHVGTLSKISSKENYFFSVRWGLIMGNVPVPPGKRIPLVLFLLTGFPN
jgi:hypothetical protein